MQHSDLNLTPNHLPDYSQQPNFIQTNQPDIVPDLSQAARADSNPNHDSHQTSSLDSHHQQVWTVNSSYATVPGGDRTMNGPHIDIRDNGHIYLHQLNGHTVDVGDVRGHAMYNSSGWEVGYFKDNGEVYKYNYHSADNFIGKIDNGHIYNVDHKEIGRADTNLEGAAHLLFVVGGGAMT
ncbi:hypothetical protein QUB60_22870 [Microcoleus sp. A2-C5]|uniref:hypothetical protein n=1 Tax=unclassified Microcoleus TaxID=2642155 RepID=UPI002FD05575